MFNRNTSKEKIRKTNEHSIILFTCSYCGEKLDMDKKSSTINSIPSSKKTSPIFFDNSCNDDICPKCKQFYTKCSVCSFPIKLNKNLGNHCIISCTKCSHGGHFEHYQSWFSEFNECPNSKCNCRCQEIGQAYSN